MANLHTLAKSPCKNSNDQIWAKSIQIALLGIHQLTELFQESGVPYKIKMCGKTDDLQYCTLFNIIRLKLFSRDP